MHNSVNAPLYPVFHNAIWELAAVHQVLVALDELQYARQQSVLLTGRALLQAQTQLKKAERDLMSAKTVLLKVLGELGPEPNFSPHETVQDLEAAWESNLLHPVPVPLPLPEPSL